jgi:mono/diheme cytochrome c family protein
MRDLSVPAALKNAKNPISPSPQVIGEARAHFADHCAMCHANNGSGETPMGQNMYPRPPDMRRSETQQMTDGQLYSIIHNGVRLTGMPAWGEESNDSDSWKLVLFIRHLPQLTPAEEKEMEALNPKAPAELNEEKEEEEFLKGGPLPQEHNHMARPKGDMK